MKKMIASVLAVSLIVPAFSYLGTIKEAKAAEDANQSTIEIGDMNGDGMIDAMELVNVKKARTIDKAMQIHMEYQNEDPTNVVTKNAYFGGKMTFEAFVPEGITGETGWWGVAPTTTQTTSIYTIAGGYALNNDAKRGDWAEYEVKIPNDGQSYYLSIGGVTGTNGNDWAGKQLLIDNVKIYDANGALVAEEKFDNGFADSIFNVNETGKSYLDWGEETAVDLYTHPGAEQLTKDGDLDGSGVADDTDADLMRQFLVNKIYSFYKADTSSVNNDTSKYQVTDELDRELADTKAQTGKAVGIRYFLHFGTGDTNKLYSVSDILKNNSNAYSSSEAWLAAGGGAVGTKHWWGKSLFGYYTSMDKWVVERDVQMLTDAGIDFLAIDTTDGVYTEQLKVLLEVLNKYYNQGFNVPKVTFTSDVTSAVSDLKNTYSHLWYTADTIDAIANMSTVHVAESMGEAMSSGAFYGDKTNHSRSYNGKKIIGEDGAILQGYNFEYEFEEALTNGADVILVENWNEWLAERATGTDAEPIVLNENADMENSSDIQPMDGGYGDDYYMQLIDCIKEFKGNSVINNKLNTAIVTESVDIDITGDLKQWNKVSTHYLDYTDEIGNRDAEGYDAANVGKQAVVAAGSLGTGKPEFITKKAYPGGSKVTFDAYAPARSGDSWWAICYATDKNADIPWSNFLEFVAPDNPTTGAWTNFEVTLPTAEEEYYIYFFANVGAWQGNTFIIDNVQITTGTTTEIDTFDNGISAGLFDVSGSAVSEQTVTTATNQAMEIQMEYQDDAQVSVVTDNTYSGGKVVFEAFVPNGIADQGWWGVLPTTTQNTDIWAVAGKNLYDSNKLGKWAEYEVEIPKDGQSYYLAIGGNTGTSSDWVGKSLLIDNFRIYDANGDLVAEDDFNHSYSYGLFKVSKTGKDFSTWQTISSPVGLYDRKTTYENSTGRNDISKMKMTSDGENLYALVETVDAIKGFGKANCMSLFISTGNVGGCWNQYEYVVNRDSSKAEDGKVTIEKYVGGAWKKVGSAAYYIDGNVMQLAIPLETIGCSKDYDLEFKWADNYSEDDIYSFYTKGDAAPYGRVNYVYRYEMVDRYAAINVDHLNTTYSEANPMNFITSQKYPAGSTITVNAFVPTGVTWWSIHFATDNTSTGIWENCNDRRFLNDDSKKGKWATYSETLSTSAEDSYIYIAGARGEWSGGQLLIDDVIITDSAGNVIAKETFDNGYGIFDVTETDWENQVAVELKEKEVTEASNQSAELHFEYFDAGNGAWDFITADAYPEETKIVFDAYIPTASTNDWWGALITTTPNDASIYNCAGGNAISYEKDQWITVERTTTEDGQYLAIGGPQGFWKNASVFVDNFRIYNADGELIAKDDFSKGLHGGIFDIDEVGAEKNKTVVSLGTPEEVETPKVTYENGALELTFSDRTSHVSYMSYPAGSTVTFDAYVTTESSDVWWGVDSIQDRANDTYVYATDPYGGATQVWNANPYYYNDWATYTWSLDSTGFIAFEGHGFSKLIIDNIVITSPQGRVLAKEDFDNETLEDSMFEILLSNHASLVEGPKSEAEVLFTAYDSPTINGSTSGDAYAIIDEAYKKVAEAGFNKLLPIHEGYSTVADAQAQSNDLLTQVQWRSRILEDAVQTSLELAQKHGLAYYVKDWSFYGLGKTQDDAAMFTWTNVNQEAQFSSIIMDMFDENNPYINHPAYAGSYAVDEPSDIPGTMTNDFQALTWQAKYYNQAMQNLIDAGKIDKAGEFYVNLKGANYEHIDDRKWYEKLGEDLNIYSNTRYAEYVNKYVTFAKAQGIDYIAWDLYPFMETGQKNKETVETNYLYNFKIMADNAKDNSLKLRYTLQSSNQSQNGYRAVTDVDLRFQIYTGMAFGVNDFTYFKYSADGTEAEAIFNYKTGETNETLYNYAKDVNREVHAIEDWFADYKWSNIMTKQGSESTTMSDRMIAGMELSNSDSITHGKINSVTATQDTIAGIFEAKDSAATSTRPYGYMFVNLADPTESKKDTVTINFADGVKGVCVCINGKQEMVSVSGNYTFTLEPGAGAFIVPIQ